MNGAVAQLVAHLHGMEGVRGSNPLSSTPTSTPTSTRLRWHTVFDALGPTGPGAFVVPSLRLLTDAVLSALIN